MHHCCASFPPAMNRAPAFTRLFWRGFPKLDSEFCSRPRGAGRGRGEREHVGTAASEPGLHSLPARAVTGTGRMAARSAHSVTAVTPSLARLGTSDPPGRRLDGPTQGHRWVYTRVLRAQWSGDFRGCPCWGGVLLESRGWGPGCRSAPYSAQDRGTWPQSPCCLGRILLWTEPATHSLGRVWLVGVTGAPPPSLLPILSSTRPPRPLCSLQLQMPGPAVHVCAHLSFYSLPPPLETLPSLLGRTASE